MARKYIYKFKICVIQSIGKNSILTEILLPVFIGQYNITFLILWSNSNYRTMICYINCILFGICQLKYVNTEHVFNSNCPLTLF